MKAPPATFFFPNDAGKGYYRVEYTSAAFKALAANAETGLTAAERVSLIGDEWAQMRANKATVGDFLNLVDAVKGDSNAVVLNSVVGDVAVIFQRIVANKEEREGLAAWVRATFGPQLAKLGEPGPGDSPNVRELRARLFDVLGSYGKDPAVLARAREIAEAYIADPASVDATLGQTALSVAARNGDSGLYEHLQKVHETSTNPEIQQGSLRLLATFEEPALAQRGLEYAISGKVRNQDSAIQLSIALQNPMTRDQSWNYIKTNWDKVRVQFTTWSGADVVFSTSSFCSAAARDEVEKFFAEHTVPNSSVALKQSIQRIDGCIEMRKLQEPNLQHWLAMQPKS